MDIENNEIIKEMTEIIKAIRSLFLMSVKSFVYSLFIVPLIYLYFYDKKICATVEIMAAIQPIGSDPVTPIRKLAS